MRHHVTIGITDREEVVVLKTSNDIDEHRAVLATLVEKGGRLTQRQRFQRALTLSTDHPVALRRFPIEPVTSDTTKPAAAENLTSAPPSPAAPDADTEKPAPARKKGS